MPNRSEPGTVPVGKDMAGNWVRTHAYPMDLPQQWERQLMYRANKQNHHQTCQTVMVHAEEVTDVGKGLGMSAEWHMIFRYVARKQNELCRQTGQSRKRKQRVLKS